DRHHRRLRGQARTLERGEQPGQEAEAARPDVVAEAPAGGAGAQVRAQPAAAQDAPVAVHQRALHVEARRLAALVAARQRAARLQQRLLDRARRRLQQLRDLGGPQAVDLAQDERRALALRQVREVLLEDAQRLLQLGSLVDAAERGELGVELLRR